MDGTNTMSGETSGLQRRFRHEVLHAKYVNCRNHKLALVFVHLLKDQRFQALKDVDTILLSVWKLVKYSSAKAAVYGEAQVAEGQKKLKLLKAAATRWLSHGEASKPLVSRLPALVNALDSMLNAKNDPEIKEIRDALLAPNTLLMLLLLADLLVHINRFSVFLQKKNLIYADISSKLERLKESIKELVDEDGPLFNQFAREYLHISHERMELARRLRGNELTDNEVEINRVLNSFDQEIKKLFLREVLREVEVAIQVNDPVFLAFDIFNPNAKLSKVEIKEKVNRLIKFYGESKDSKFGGEVNKADPLINLQEITDECIDRFFDDFDRFVKKEEDKRNADIRSLVNTKELEPNKIVQYKDDHPIVASKIYKLMFLEHEQYDQLLKIFKFSLLITPSTANVERGFSVLTLLATKQRNSQSLESQVDASCINWS